MSLDRVLDKCLWDIQAGKATVEECLARYPELAEELEPLLRMGEALMQLSAVEPSPEFVAQTRMRLLALKPPAPEAITRPPGFSLQRWLAGFAACLRSWQWQRAFVGALAILMAVVLIGGGTVVASAESLPDHPLYPVKRAVESARLLLAASPESRAMLHVEFANRRLNEAVAVAQKGQLETAKNLLTEYNSELMSALLTLAQAAAEGNPVSEVSVELRGQVAGQQSAVEGARETLPDEAVDSALDMARKVDTALAELASLRPGDRARPEHPTPTSLPSFTPTSMATPRPRIAAPARPPHPTRVPPTQRPEVEAPKATPVIVVLPTATPESYTEPPRLTPILVLPATDTPWPSTPTPTQPPPQLTPTAPPATPTNTPVPPTVTPRGPTPTEATPTEVPPTATPQTPIPRPPTPTLTSQPPAAPTTSSGLGEAPMPTSQAP